MPNSAGKRPEAVLPAVLEDPASAKAASAEVSEMDTVPASPTQLGLASAASTEAPVTGNLSAEETGEAAAEGEQTVEAAAETEEIAQEAPDTEENLEEEAEAEQEQAGMTSPYTPKTLEPLFVAAVPRGPLVLLARNDH